MTIKQQGGVFGRNPKFNDVEVDGTLTTDNFTLDGTPVTATGAELNYVDVTTLGRGQASKAVTADASGNVFLGNKAFLSDTSAGHAFAQGGNAGLGYSARDGMIHSYNQLGSGGQTIRFLYQGSPAGYIDVYNTYATFRPSNGGGIDFSATSGTGTSELFDDYEEGTFTPSFTNLTVGNGSVFGRYTKIGRIVNVELGFVYGSTSSISGSIGDITGLPFTSVSINSNVFQLVVGSVFKPGTGWSSIVSHIPSNSSNLLATEDFSGTAITPTTPRVFASGTSLTISIQYEVA